MPRWSSHSSQQVFSHRFSSHLTYFFLFTMPGNRDCDWRLELNNLLQRSYGTNALSWEDGQSGPQNTTPWVSIAYINNVEYGRGEGWTKSDARREASRIACGQLERQLAGRNH